MEQLEALYKELKERQEYLSTEIENRRSPYMQARLDECRLTLVRVQQMLFKEKFGLDT